MAKYRRKHKHGGDPPPSYLPDDPQSVKRFQDFHNLPRTGVIDPRTERHMRSVGTRRRRRRAPRGPIPTTWA